MANFVPSYSTSCRVGRLALALICLLAASCDFSPEPGDGKASLTINLPGAKAQAHNSWTTARAVHLPEAITDDMSYSLDFYRSDGYFSIGPTTEKMITLELEPGHWDIVATALYGSADAAVGKESAEIRAGQENTVSFMMEADYFLTPGPSGGANSGPISINIGDTPPSVSITMNTSTVFSGIPGWADNFSYRWYSETGGDRTVLGSPVSFSGSDPLTFTYNTTNNSTPGIFYYGMEITNNFIYTSPEDGTTTSGSVGRDVYVANVVVGSGGGGGTYSVGETGPGGGIVFYVDPAGFTSNGVLCHYLEVAPVALGPAEWGLDGITISPNSDEIGTGYANTQTILLALAGRGETGMAAQIAAAYTGGGFADWFLPSKGELEELFLRSGQGAGLGSSIWSSTEADANRAWCVGNASGGGFWDDPKIGAWGGLTFRPVRAF